VGEHVVLDEGGDVTRETLVAEGYVVSCELVRPPVPFVVCGAGTDAIPVARLAASLGWHVTVVDHRSSFVTRERFPEADEIVRVNVADDPGALAGAVTLDADTAAVCMAHSASHDRAYLHALVEAGVGYVGVLGPRRRTVELLTGAKGDALTVLPPAVHSPVGLDLGAETPDEIALAIVAEITAVRNGRLAGMLRDHQGPIHTNRRPVAELSPARPQGTATTTPA
jgi:xanthine/CO dehydrogenase XdhC/CoxF family maturation factor